MTLSFGSGDAFGIAGPVRLTLGRFMGHEGPFELVGGGGRVEGTAILSSAIGRQWRDPQGPPVRLVRLPFDDVGGLTLTRCTVDTIAGFACPVSINCEILDSLVTCTSAEGTSTGTVSDDLSGAAG